MESEQPKSMQKIMHQNYFKTMQSKTKMKIGYYKMLQRSVYWFCLLALIIICTIEVGIPKQEFLDILRFKSFKKIIMFAKVIFGPILILSRL